MAHTDTNGSSTQAKHAPLGLLDRAPGWLPPLLAILAVVFATILIVKSYSDISQTWDESAHIGTGLEWIQKGTYTLDPIDPPLPRVSTAIGPYLLGARFIDGEINPWEEGNRVLLATGDNHRFLTAARLGILPYFLIAAFLTWRITRRWLGIWPAAIATILFATNPTVLAHAGLATTDMAFVAAFLFVLDRLWRALESSTLLNYCIAGIAFGLACLCKLSAVPYVFLCAFVFILYFFWTQRRLPRVGHLVVTFVTAYFVLWAGYHFSLGSIATTTALSRQTAEHFAHRFGPLHAPVLWLMSHCPAYQFFQGIRVATRLQHDPPPGYLFGQVYTGGRWFFFLIMLLLKTPIALLILALSGIVLAIRRFAKQQDGFVLVPLAGIVFPILVATHSHINIGVRHVLVVYPLFAMLAAIAAIELLRPRKWQPIVPTAILSALLVWQLIACIRIAPDFITYFNEPAAPYAASIRVDSDFDWGQDMYRLCAKLKQMNIHQVAIAYDGAADLRLFDLPSWTKLNPYQHVTGWVAISEATIRSYPDAYNWLNQYPIVTEAGHTIRIYHID